MSDNNSVEENHPLNENGKKVVGTPDDVSRFEKGDLVKVHLEMKGQVFTVYPHEENGVVVALEHEDDEYFYHMPVVQFAKEQRMFNPDHLIIEQKANGDAGEMDKLKEARKATKKQKAAAEKEA